MLFQLLDEVYTRINKMDYAVEAPLFSAQLRKLRPTIQAELNSQGIVTDESMEKSLLALSVAQLFIIKGLPAIGGELSKILQSSSVDTSFRCVVAASLAYFVQPRDLLPDDLPGGYGFVDDALFLHEACALSWELAGDMPRAEEKRKIFQFIFNFVPDGSRELFQREIRGLALTLNIMRTLGPAVAEMTTQTLIANPLQPVAPAGQTGVAGGLSPYGSQFASYPTTVEYQYSWRDGNTMGVNFPGGGGVATDGRNIYVL